MNIAMVITALGGLALIFVNDMRSLMIVAGFIGGGMGFYLTSNWTMAVKLSPADQAGRFLGLTNLATAGASALGKLEGPLIDLLNKVHPTMFLGYKFIFFLCFICSVFSFILFQKLNQKNATKSQN
jgi:MFS family permease